MNNGRLRNIAVVVAFMFVSAVGAAPAEERSSATLIRDLGIEESERPVREMPFWRKPDKIYLVAPGYDDAERAEQLRTAQDAAGDVQIVAISEPVPPEIIRSADVILARCTPEMIRDGDNLRWLQDSRHGVDACMVEGIEDKSFILTNAQHTSAPPMADHAIALALMLARGLHRFHALQMQEDWQDDFDIPVVELHGKTMLVVGLGGVGTEVARRAHGLGMEVLAVRNSSREGPDFVSYVGLPTELYDLAARADIVINSLPLTDETRGVFDRRFFDAIKRGAYFVSIGRGETTMTDDLVAALKDGRVAAAGLDVVDPEPLPRGHELWNMPNVVITPHMAATTDEGRWRRWVVILENIRRYVAGERMLNVVDVSKGY